jgi:hypothetical protein
MRRLREIFRLTSAEQRVIVIVILALLAIAIFQKHHEQIAPNLPEQAPTPATTPHTADAD